jgi:hypothetical protein
MTSKEKGEEFEMGKNRRFLAGEMAAWVLAVAMAFGLVLASCDGGMVSGEIAETKLRGTWESTDSELYSGTLVIDWDTITISGYGESQTPPTWQGGDDSKRPFRDFAKNVPLSCYTEDGNLFITTAVDTKSVPYRYSTSGLDKYLLFNFGGRDEALKKNEQ